MEIERCRPEGDDWKITVRYEGQPVTVMVSRENIDDLLPDTNPSEVHVLQALREHRARFEDAVKSAVMKTDSRPAEFSSLHVVRE